MKTVTKRSSKVEPLKPDLAAPEMIVERTEKSELSSEDNVNPEFSGGPVTIAGLIMQ